MSATPVREKQEIGLPVPDFTLPLISGGEQRALAGFLEEKQGAVVLFWSGLCSHCLRYDDYLNRFVERHPELGLVAVPRAMERPRIRFARSPRNENWRSLFCTTRQAQSPASGTRNRRRARS